MTYLQLLLGVLLLVAEDASLVVYEVDAVLAGPGAGAVEDETAETAETASWVTPQLPE